MKKNNNRGRKSMAFTPRPTKRNDSKSRRSVSSLNLDNSEKLSSDTLFDTLMGDPAKRKMIMKLLSQERENIEKYKQDEEKKNVAKLKRHERLLHCESPTALLRRRALEKNRRDSDSSSTTSASDTRSVTATPIPFENLLNGVIAYVEIRSKEGDRSAGAKALMQAMGATIKDNFTTDVTHVIFKDGSFTTYQKAKLKKVHLVSILWLEAVRRNNFRVSEKNYPALGTELFDINITQICSDYEKLVEEEKRLSRIKGRKKTALPTELQAVQLDDDSDLLPVAGRLSEVVIPTSQNWEAESVISCASGTLPLRRNIFPGEDSDRFPVSTPELTSDDDSDCGVINGHSFKRDSLILDLDIIEKVQNEPGLETSSEKNTSSTRSASLLHRKSSYQLVDMDLTTNINENIDKENINVKSRKSGMKTRRDSILLPDSSTNLNQIDTRRKSMRIKSDKFLLPVNEKLFKKSLENNKNCADISTNKSSDLVQTIRSSTSELMEKTQKKNSLNSSDETPSLRFSTSSDKKSNSGLIQGQKIYSSDEMASLRISTSVSSNDTLNKKGGKKITSKIASTERNNKKSSLTSEDMPSLRISSSSNDTSGRMKTRRSSMILHSNSSIDEVSKDLLNVSEKKKDGLKSLMDAQASASVEKKKRKLVSSEDEEDLEKKRKSSRLNKIRETEKNNQSVDEKTKKNNLRSSKSLLNSEEMPSIDEVSKDLLNVSEKKKDGLKSLMDGQANASAEKKKRKMVSSEDEEDTEKKRKSSRLNKIHEYENNNQSVDEKTKKNNLRSSKSSLNSEEMSSLRISTSQSNDMVVEKTKTVDDLSKEQNLNEDLFFLGRNLETVSSENQNNNSCGNNDEEGDVEQISSAKEINLADSLNNISLRSQARDSKSTSNNVSNRSYKSNEFTPLDESCITDIISSLESPKPPPQERPKDIDKKQNLEGTSKNKTYRKLYNLNQSSSELLKDFERTDKVENKEETTSNNVITKKICTVPLAPIAVTPIAKQLLDKRNLKKTQAKNKKLPKKNLPKPQKKVVLVDSSKDEQKELAEEYVKRRRIDNEEAKLQTIARRSQRLSQYQKKDYQEQSSNSEDPIKPERNRRSTFDFVQTSPKKSQKRTEKKKRFSIVCTRMHKPEVQTFMQIVRKLGSFFIQDEVTEKTSHLIVGESKRTINLLKALARGCWILKHEWLFKSLEASKWLPEEDYEITDFSPAVQICRKERQAFGSLYSMDIFENCGPIFIARSTIPRRSDLQELVELCKGTVTSNALNAKIVVGKWIRYENVISVNEMWILDSITFNKRKPFKNYYIERSN